MFRRHRTAGKALTVFRIGLPLTIAAVLLAGCDEEDTSVPAEVVKSIKHYTVVEPAGGSQRSYTGTLAASDTSALSFAVSGTVQTVDVAQGDSVTAGQALATLDPKPFNLDVEAARAELASAQAAFTEKETEIERQRQLFEKGWVAKAALEQAVAAFDGASAQLDYARARLSIAERNLANATLTAPFDGKIAERSIEPFQEASAGQAQFLINADGAMEIDISVSDAIISRLNAGATVTVNVPNIDGCGCTARITEIGTASGAANTVTVTAALLDGPAALLPGMSAEVQVPLGQLDGNAGFLIPLTAIAPGDDASSGYIFLYDPDEGGVRRTPIRGGDGLSGNLVAVVGDIKAGDIIAAAGVSFLRDGQSVKLLGE